MLTDWTKTCWIAAATAEATDFDVNWLFVSLQAWWSLSFMSPVLQYCCFSAARAAPGPSWTSATGSRAGVAQSCNSPVDCRASSGHQAADSAWSAFARPLAVGAAICLVRSVRSARRVFPGLSGRRSRRATSSGRLVSLLAVPSARGDSSSSVASQEYLEEYDALGAPLEGKCILVGWDPGPAKNKASAGGVQVPPFSPEESMEELENLCKSIDLE
ncbi:unnamed protein product, partial [Polarella glacialis]